MLLRLLTLGSLVIASSAAAQSMPSDASRKSAATSYDTPPDRSQVQRYLDLQERYARGLSKSQLENEAVKLEQEVRSQQVDQDLDEVETQLRNLLGKAIGSPHEQAVKDALKVLEARHSVPKGQQVYFEKRYRSAPTTTSRVISPPLSTYPSAPSYTPAPSYSSPSASTTRPQSTTVYPSDPTYSSPSYVAPSYPSSTYSPSTIAPSGVSPAPYGF